MNEDKLKKVVEDTVKSEADDVFEDMICHPNNYEGIDPDDEDDCWVKAIENAKDSVWANPTGMIDEDAQEEMTEQNWHDVYRIIENITWLTFASDEVKRCFACPV